MLIGVQDRNGKTITVERIASDSMMQIIDADGTYRADRIPMLAGVVGRANQDGTTTLRDKSGCPVRVSGGGVLWRI